MLLLARSSTRKPINPLPCSWQTMDLRRLNVSPFSRCRASRLQTASPAIHALAHEVQNTSLHEVNQGHMTAGAPGSVALAHALRDHAALPTVLPP